MGETEGMVPDDVNRPNCITGEYHRRQAMKLSVANHLAALEAIAEIRRKPKAERIPEFIRSAQKKSPDGSE